MSAKMLPCPIKGACKRGARHRSSTKQYQLCLAASQTQGTSASAGLSAGIGQQQAPQEEAAPNAIVGERVWTMIHSSLRRKDSKVVKPPTFKSDDNIVMMMRKVTKWGIKTEDLGLLSDEELLGRIGAKPREYPADTHEWMLGALPGKADKVTFGVEDLPSGREGVVVMVRDGRTADSRYRTRRAHSDITSFRLISENAIAEKGFVSRFRNSLNDRMDKDGLDEDQKEMVSRQLGRILSGSMKAKSFDAVSYRARANEIQDRLVREGNEPVSDSEMEEAFRRSQGGPRVARWKANDYIEDFILDELEVERDAAANQSFLDRSSGGSSATVFEQKKNIPQSHLDAADNSRFRKDFRHVEVDEDVDLSTFRQVDEEWSRLSSIMPKADSPASLRFRKTGRHKAAGIYHSAHKNIAVDPRTPHSMVHEYIHHCDFNTGETPQSTREDFRGILRSAQRNIGSEPELAAKSEYYRTPTEVFARSGEIAAHWMGIESSLAQSKDIYENSAEYRVFHDNKQAIIDYWKPKFNL